MKAFAILFAIVATAVAQEISIGEPVTGDTLTAGQDTVVSVLEGVRNLLQHFQSSSVYTISYSISNRTP